jgi:hypothetical protein
LENNSSSVVKISNTLQKMKSMMRPNLLRRKTQNYH